MMKTNGPRVVFVIALLVTPVSLQQQVTQKKLFPVVQADKFGFIDEHGRLVIEPQYGGSLYGGASFSEGLAAVRTSDGWVYINQSGEIVLRTNFDSAGSFSEGLAAVGVAKTRAGRTPHDLQWGFIDKTGKIVIEPQFDNVEVFRDGMAKIYVYERDESDSKEKVGFIDKQGRVVVKPIFDNAYWFSEGLANVPLADGKRGYIDKTGRVVSNPDYEYTWAWFSEGLTPAKKGDKWGYVS